MKEAKKAFFAFSDGFLFLSVSGATAWSVRWWLIIIGAVLFNWAIFVLYDDLLNARKKEDKDDD